MIELKETLKNVSTLALRPEKRKQRELEQLIRQQAKEMRRGHRASTTHLFQLDHSYADVDGDGRYVHRKRRTGPAVVGTSAWEDIHG